MSAPTNTKTQVGRSEHISLESDVAETRAQPNPERPLVAYEIGKGGRNVTTRVAILPDQFVLVETQRTRSSTDAHTVDLRFVDPRPVGIRKVAWPFLYLGIGVTVLTAASIALYAMFPSVAQRIGGVFAPVGLGVLALMSYLLCYLLTRESLLFLSAHGRARVVTIAGRLGTMRRAQACAADLVAHIKLARRQFQQTRQAYLRDEMREHLRLYEQGVLTDEHYANAKKRILQAHE